MKHSWNFRDITGQKSGRLTAIRYYGKSKSGHSMWECLCECGGISIAPISSLTRKLTQSCGCLHREKSSKNGKANVRHGESRRGSVTPEYMTWSGMQARCNSNLPHQYPIYKSRGIKVCDRWKSKGGFENFLSDMGRRPGNGFSIDRINVNGNYEPSNCRWADKYLQRANQRPRKSLDQFTTEELEMELSNRVAA